MAGFSLDNVYQYYGLGPHDVRLPDGTIAPAPPPAAYAPPPPAGPSNQVNQAPTFSGAGSGAQALPEGLYGSQSTPQSVPQSAPQGPAPRPSVDYDKLSAMADEMQRQKLAAMSGPAALDPGLYNTSGPSALSSYDPKWGF